MIKIEIGGGLNIGRIELKLKYDPEIGKGSENPEILALWGRVDRYANSLVPSYIINWDGQYHVLIFFTIFPIFDVKKIWLTRSAPYMRLSRK